MSEDRLRLWMEANRLNWDDRTAIHLRNSSGFYAIDRVKAGDDLFHGCEDAELGEVAGKRLIHLQCHFGLDTIRLARRGATATGLDFSAPALAAARALAAELKVAVRFVEGNIYDVPSLLEGEAYRTTSPLSPGAQSSGCPISAAGRRSSPGCSRRVDGSISPRDTLRPCRSKRSTAGW
jgi:SAM-dependent methyltransferase